MTRSIISLMLILAGFAASGQGFRVLIQPGAVSEGIACFQRDDSSYLAVANTSGFSSFNQLYLLKLNSDGSFRSDNALPLNGTTRVRQARPLNPGIVMIAGIADNGQDYNGLFMLIDTNAQLITRHEFGGEDWESFNTIASSDGLTFCLGGYSYSGSAGGSDAWILGVDSSGDSLWSIRYGSSGDDAINDIVPAPWGYLACGYTQTDTAADILLIAFDPLGDTLWTRSWGSPSRDVGLGVAMRSDSGFVIAGQTAGFGAIGNDGFMAGFDKLGNLIWNQIYPGSKEDYLKSVIVVQGDSLAAAGTTNSFGAGREEFSLYLTNPNGSFLGGGSFGGLSHDYFHSMSAAADGGYVLCGSSSSFGTAQQGMFIVKTNAIGQTSTSTTVITSIAQESPGKFQAPYPNPGQGMIMMPDAFSTCLVRNISGQVLARWELKDGEMLDITMLVPGIYLLELKGPHGDHVFKYVKSH